jgi:hypothetical protein
LAFFRISRDVARAKCSQMLSFVVPPWETVKGKKRGKSLGAGTDFLQGSLLLPCFFQPQAKEKNKGKIKGRKAPLTPPPSCSCRHLLVALASRLQRHGVRLFLSTCRCHDDRVQHIITVVRLRGVGAGNVTLDLINVCSRTGPACVFAGCKPRQVQVA